MANPKEDDLESELYYKTMNSDFQTPEEEDEEDEDEGSEWNEDD